VIRALGGGVVALGLATDERPHVGAAEVDALAAAVAAIAADETVRAVVVEGGARRFCLGATRETLTAPDAAARLAHLTHELPRLLLAIPVPAVAAMAGHAVGGGFALGLWCDVALVGEESLYGANFATLGFTPGMGSTVVVEEAVGAPRARELLFTGRLVKGRDLAPLPAWPRAEVVARARALAAEIAAAPREVLAMTKASLAARRRARLEAVLVEEKAMHDRLFSDEETRRRVAEAYGAGVEDPP
jgi:polyketide biosynthesis enoyl-CoA hydratase PksI